MDAAGSSIADDWEYVDDDTFSVTSLASEVDVPEPSRGQPAVRAVSSLADDPIYPSRRPRFESPTCNGSQPPYTDREPKDAQAVGRSGTNEAGVVEPGTPRVQLGEKITSDGDLDALCENIPSLIKLLRGILSSPCLRDQSYGIPRQLKPTCESLRSQLDWIQDMWRIYAQHPKAKLPTGLSDWMDSLELELRRIQGRFAEPTTQHSIASKISYFDSADECHQKIETLRIRMDAIIRVAHSDFQKLRSPLTLAPRGSSPIPNRKTCERPPNCIAPLSKKTSVSHLRRELYTLRDHIVACLGEFHSCEHHGLYDPGQRNKITILTISYQKTKESLERMISNQVPDWAGGLMSFEFRQLNPDTIRSLSLQLKEVTDLLFVERNKVQNLRRSDGRREYEKLVIDASNMDTLCTIDETLISILRHPTRK
ncbi:hypothetical protein CHU98_g10350 [Xylaria longipes]|nr:hypothetical protein CHU98_g10350 [Xylaria longipes]